MRTRTLLASLAAAGLLLAACSDGGDTASTATTTGASTNDEPAVVASTTWTGALARLAGAGEVTVLAPSSLQHPPDFDPRASDLVAVADADFVVYAPFESFAERLQEAAGAGAELFQVELENTTEAIKREVLAIAEVLGTTDEAQANLDKILPELDALGEEVAASIDGEPPTVVAQTFMAYWADWAGLTTAATFGPASIGAGELADLLSAEPDFVLDNVHIPGGQALEANGIPRISLANYPGDDLDLVALFNANRDLLLDAVAGEVTADPDIEIPAAGEHR